MIDFFYPKLEPNQPRIKAIKQVHIRFTSQKA